MPNLPSGISSMKLKVSTFEQDISSASLGNNSIQITDSNIISAFNNNLDGTIFNPSIAVTYNDTAFPSVSEILTPTVIPNYVPKKITPSISLPDIPNKFTTDVSFNIVPSITNRGTGVLFYSSSHEGVATVDESTGVVTIVGAGTTTITVSLAASADQVYAAASVSKSFTVNKAIPQLSLSSSSLSKLTTDDPFPLYELVTKEGTGELTYQITHESVATVNASGVVTIVGAGTTTITVSLLPSSDGKWAATSVSISLTVSVPTWRQRGADINGEAANDASGQSVSLSADGSIVAIGTSYNDGNGNNSGHVRVYEYNGTNWVQRGADINGEAANDASGWSVSLSADGSIVAIGALYNDGNGDSSGHVRVYEYNGINWVPRGADINGEAAYDYSGQRVSLSADGSIVAIDAQGNDGNGGDSNGHVRVYYWDTVATPNEWRQRGADIDGEAQYDESGYSVSLSADGSVVAIGAVYNGNFTGHVRVYQYDANKTTAVMDDSSSNFGPIGWNRLGNDIDGEAAYDSSGQSVSLSADGSVVAIGALYNDGNGNNSGHVRVYQYNGTNWVQRGADINGEAVYDESGWSVSLSADGSVVAISARGNDGNGNSSGHVRVYEYNGTNWVPRGADIDGEAAYDSSGQSVSLSADGSIVAIGAPYNDGNGNNSGHVRVYKYE